MEVNGLLPFGGLSVLADAVVLAFGGLGLCLLIEHWRDKPERWSEK